MPLLPLIWPRSPHALANNLERCASASRAYANARTASALVSAWAWRMNSGYAFNSPASSWLVDGSRLRHVVPTTGHLTSLFGTAPIFLMIAAWLLRRISFERAAARYLLADAPSPSTYTLSLHTTLPVRAPR